VAEIQTSQDQLPFEPRTQQVNRTEVPLDSVEESATAEKIIQIGKIESMVSGSEPAYDIERINLHTSQSPSFDSPTLPFELLKTPIFNRTLDSQPMKVYSRRRPRPQDQTAAPASELGFSCPAPDVLAACIALQRPAAHEATKVAVNSVANGALAADM
jgi:hypothetical protein